MRMYFIEDVEIGIVNLPHIFPIARVALIGRVDRIFQSILSVEGMSESAPQGSSHHQFAKHW